MLVGKIITVLTCTLFQLVDLGSPPYSHDSTSGCLPQESACATALGGCGLRGRCAGGLEEPQCECDPGWTGEQCATPTSPATLGPSSYMKVALSLRPTPNLLAVQFRLRSRGARDGLLLQVSAHRQPDLSLYVGICWLHILVMCVSVRMLMGKCSVYASLLLMTRVI